MTTTWTTLNGKLDILLNDPRVQNDDDTYKVQTYDRRLRIEAWNWAQDIFVHHTPRQRLIDLTIRSGDREAILPSDIYAVDGIYDSTEEQWWSPLGRRPGYRQGTSETVLEYWVWDNRLFLQDSVDRTLQLYYWAFWPRLEYVTGDNEGRSATAANYAITMREDTVWTPQWAESALVHLVCAFCLLPGAIESADINQWKVWIDAGNPNHNPRALQAQFHLSMYDDLLSRVPPSFNRRNEWQ